MLAVFNVCIDSSDAATRGVLEENPVSKSNSFLKKKILVGYISN